MTTIIKMIKVLIAIITIIMMMTIRVAEIVRGHGGPLPKSSDSDENFKSEHTLFCRELRFVLFFGDLWA